MITGILQISGAFGAGLATSLSPCVYPMIPITLGFLGAKQSTRRVFGFFMGQVLAFTALGAVAVSLGEILGFSSDIPAVQIGTGLLLILFAYASYAEKLPSFFYRANGMQSRINTDTFVGAFLVGASSAAVASPCTSPVVGGVLAALSQVEDRSWGLFLMFCFALGLSFLFLLLGLGLTKASRLPRAGAWMKNVHRVSSLLLAFGGLYFLGRGFGLL